MPSTLCAECAQPITRGTATTSLCAECSGVFHTSCLAPVNSLPLASHVCPACITCYHTLHPSPQCVTPLIAPTTTATNQALGLPATSPTTSLPSVLSGVTLPGTFSAFLGLISPIRSSSTVNRNANTTSSDCETGPTTQIDSTALHQHDRVNNPSGSKQPLSSSPEDTAQRSKSHCPSKSPKLAAAMPQPQANNTPFPAAAPDWAHAMWNLLTEMNSKFDSLATRVDRVEERMDQFETEIHTNHDEIAAMNNALSLKDPCEVHFTGIPSSLLEDPDKMLSAARNVLNAIDCTTATIHRVRPWNPQQTNGEASGCSGRYPSMVVRLSSGDTRDFVIASSAKLKNRTVQSIFGQGGNVKIFLSPIYPSPVYRLHFKARCKADDIHYLRPFVTNNIVFMRKSLVSPAVAIYSPMDLANLIPNDSPSPSPAAHMRCPRCVSTSPRSTHAPAYWSRQYKSPSNPFQRA